MSSALFFWRSCSFKAAKHICATWLNIKCLKFNDCGSYVSLRFLAFTRSCFQSSASLCKILGEWKPAIHTSCLPHTESRETSRLSDVSMTYIRINSHSMKSRSKLQNISKHAPELWHPLRKCLFVGEVRLWGLRIHSRAAWPQSSILDYRFTSNFGDSVVLWAYGQITERLLLGWKSKMQHF